MIREHSSITGFVGKVTDRQFLQSFDVRFCLLALQDFVPNKKHLAEMNLRGAEANVSGAGMASLQSPKKPAGIAPKANF
jgi:hypothetical protein